MKKQSSILWKKWLKVAACATFALMMACSDSGNELPEPEPNPIPENNKGSIDFNLKGEDGNGIPTGEPLKVESTKGAEVVISQKSSYTDPNGQVYTCEPKASISLAATADTVYAKDIKTLTTLNGSPRVQTEQSGTNPVKKTTFQAFSIGGQEIQFDLAHEVYTYTNSKQQKIEMPYIQVGQAKYGNGETTESKTASSPITLRSLSMSRVSVTDSMLYEVDAKFNVEVTTVNTKESQKQTLDFEVTYLAVVENVTELTGVLEYTLEQTEHNLKGGEEAKIILKQKSQYTDGEKAVYESEPQATLSLKAEKERVFVGAVEELTALIETEDAKTSQEGSNPTTHTFQKRWATKNQSFDWTTAYQIGYAETGEEMPYLKVGNPTLVDIELTEQGSRATMNDTTFYDVKATFEVELIPTNIEQDAEKLTFIVNYEGAVTKTISLTPALEYTLEQTEYALKGGEEMEVSIVQTSQYKNGDQAVYSHEPVAKIKFMAGKSKVYADNLETLKKHTAMEAQTGKEGTNPLKHTYGNTWKTSGGQDLVFENSWLVYTAQSGDEMPYLKIGEPKLVSIEAVEKSSRANVSDTVFYDIKAKMEVKIEGVNVDNAISETLSFDVSYDGGVVSTTELSGNIDYTINGGSSSSFNVSAGEEANVVLKQTSVYSLNGQELYRYEPEAVISFKALNSEVYVESLDALKTLIESEDATKSSSGSNPKKYSYLKSLATNGQSFDFSASYEVYNAENGDEMPYLKVGEPRLVSIDAVERTSRATVNDTVFYDVKAVFEVDVEGVNVEKALAQTISFEVNYEGGVVSKTEGPVELVSTDYRKDLIYLEPVGNLIARTSCVVYRDRKYSDGSVQTDSIYGGPWMMLESVVDIDTSYFIGSIEATFGAVNVDENNKSGVYIRSASVEVPDMSYVFEEHGGGMNDNSPGSYSTYWAEVDRSAYNSANPVEGWYYTKVVNNYNLAIGYADGVASEILFKCRIEASYYDRFLYVDGKLIDFAEFRPSWDDGVFTASDVSGGKVYTLECKGSYAGQEVHLKTSVTVTAKK